MKNLLDSIATREVFPKKRKVILVHTYSGLNTNMSICSTHYCVSHNITPEVCATHRGGYLVGFLLERFSLLLATPISTIIGFEYRSRGLMSHTLTRYCSNTHTGPTSTGFLCEYHGRRGIQSACLTRFPDDQPFVEHVSLTRYAYPLGSLSRSTGQITNSIHC